jgi:hypothetical protein
MAPKVSDQEKQQAFEEQLFANEYKTSRRRTRGPTALPAAIAAAAVFTWPWVTFAWQQAPPLPDVSTDKDHNK